MNNVPEEVLIGIGDLHGHYPALERLERELDEAYNLFNGNSVLRNGVKLVFTGDYIDRGEHSLQVIEEVRKLQEANRANIFALMGNHELLALEGFDQAARINEKVRRAEISIGKSYGEYERTCHGRNGGTATIQSFGKLDALDNYVRRMSRDDGDVRKWMKGLYQFTVMSILGKNVLFVHADVPEHFNCLQDLKDYKTLFEDHLADRTYYVFGTSREKYDHDIVRKGLFWGRLFRDYDRDSINSVADKLGMDFIVTGHTPHKGRIVSYFDRVFDIDVGMCPAYGENTPAAIVFKKDGVYGSYCGAGERKIVDF